MFADPSANNYPVHNLDTGLNYLSIQEAINAPETLNGNTIFVDAGTYYESVEVNKALSLVGEDKDRTVIDGNRALVTLGIASDGVSVSGFTLTNGYGENGQGGGGLNTGNGNIQISDIIVSDNDANWGIHLTPGSHDVNITRTVIRDNSKGGILLHASHRVNVHNCTITNNKMGIYSMNSSKLEVHWNGIYGNAIYNMKNDIAETVNGTYNYWGDTTNLKIQGNILYNPWLTESIFPFPLAISTPKNGLTVGLTTIIEVVSTHLGEISKIEYYLRDSLIGTLSDTPNKNKWELDTTRYPNDEYTITVTAYDYLGNVKTDKTRITIDNIEAPWWKTHLWSIIQVLIGVGSLLLGLLGYLKLGRKKSSESLPTFTEKANLLCVWGD